MERRGMSVVQSLHQNDPTLSFIRIDLQQDDGDDRLAQALEQNDFVTGIGFVNIPFSIIRPQFLHVIATREQLDTVHLSGVVPFEARRSTGHGGLFPFVRAIQQNPNIRSVGFCSAMPRQILTAFLDDRLGTNLKALQLAGVTVTGNSVQAAFEVALALKGNKTIERLALWICDDVFARIVLNSLTSNASLKHLTLLGGRLNRNSRIIKEALLEAVGNNFCLRSVDGTVFTDAEDEQRLEFYMDRNQRLEEWVKNPAPVRPDVWPEALQLADRAGPSTLYQSMLALSNFGVGLTAAQRERSTEPSP